MSNKRQQSQHPPHDAARNDISMRRRTKNDEGCREPRPWPWVTPQDTRPATNEKLPARRRHCACSSTPPHSGAALHGSYEAPTSAWYSNVSASAVAAAAQRVRRVSRRAAWRLAAAAAAAAERPLDCRAAKLLLIARAAVAVAVRLDACKGAMQLATCVEKCTRPQTTLLPALHWWHHAYKIGLTAAQRAGPAERRRVCRLVATIFLSIHSQKGKAVIRA